MSVPTVRGMRGRASSLAPRRRCSACALCAILVSCGVSAGGSHEPDCPGALSARSKYRAHHQGRSPTTRADRRLQLMFLEDASHTTRASSNVNFRRECRVRGSTPKNTRPGMRQVRAPCACGATRWRTRKEVGTRNMCPRPPLQNPPNRLVQRLYCDFQSIVGRDDLRGRRLCGNSPLCLSMKRFRSRAPKAMRTLSRPPPSSASCR